MKILFIPTLPYLADPVFINMARILQQFDESIELSYFHIEDGEQNRGKSNSYNELENNFDNIIIEKVPKTNLKERKSALLTCLKTRTPDRLVFITDKSFEYRLVQIFFKTTKRIVVQPATRFYDDPAKSGWKNRLKFWWFKSVLKLPKVPKPKSLGFDDRDAKFLFWSQFWYPPNYKELKLKCFEVGPLPFMFTPKIEEHKISSKKYHLIVLNKRSKSSELKFNSIVKMIKEILEQSQDYYILKVHPQEDLEYFSDLFNQFDNVSITKDGNIDDLILDAKTLIAPWSTVVYNAFFKGLPVVLINPNGIFDFSKKMPITYPYIRNQSSEVLETLTKLSDIEFLNSGNYKTPVNSTKELILGKERSLGELNELFTSN